MAPEGAPSAWPCKALCTSLDGRRRLESSMAPADSLRVRGAIPFAAAAAAAVEGTTTARADADPFTRRGEAERGDADREDVARGERARRDNVCAAGSCADLGPACMLGRPRPGSPRWVGWARSIDASALLLSFY